MSAPLKLLFCMRALGNPGGGAERVFVDVANGLKRRGHLVKVLTFEPADRQSFYPLDPAIPRIGLNIGSPNTPSSLGDSIRRLPALRRHVAEEDPHIAVGFMVSMYVPLAAALLKTGIPLVASEHNVPMRYAGHPAQWWLLRLAARIASRVTIVSEQARQLYPEPIGRRMTVIPNPVTLDRAGKADVLAAPGNAMTLLSAGRLHPQKDHETLIRAFARIASRHPHWRLRIVGDGTLRCHLEDVVRQLALEGRVELPGTVADVASAYQSAQLYATPSRFESLGLATVEALAHGLPVIGFADCPGTNELIHNSVNGVLIDAKEDRIDGLARALDILMSDDALRARLAASAAGSVQRYDLDQILDEWEALLKLVISDPSGPPSMM